jgi:predicted RNA-binding protein with PIN domain
MSLHFALDGYNIIHTVPEFSSQDHCAAIQRLLHFVAINRPQGSARNAVSVFFDGYPPPGVGAAPGGVSVVFSGETTADDKIQQLAGRCRNPKVLIVVTDDRDLRRSVKGCGAKVMAVDEFMRKGMDSAQPSSAALKPGLAVTEAMKITTELKRLWLKE